MDVMFYEAFAEEAKILQRLLPPGMDAEFSPLTIQACWQERPPAAIISVRTQSEIPSAWAAELSGILTRSAGFDHLQAYQRACGRCVPCGYLVDYCSRAVAEQAVLLMMALFRKFPRQMEQLDTFQRDGITGRECKGSAALVVGVGKIGSEIVDILRGLGMDVKGVDIAPKKQMEYVDLNEGLSWADAVFCALPLTEETRGLLNYERLSANEKRPVIINIARGEILPVSDLERLFQADLLGGVAMDVFANEDKLAESLREPSGWDRGVEDLYRLKTYGNVIFTPHNAFNTQEALERKCQQSMVAVEAFLSSGRFPVML